MPVLLKTGTFLRADGSAMEDFEALATGVIASIPQTIGTAGCILREGTFAPRE